MFFDENVSKTKETYYLECGLYSSITGIVETMNTLIQERNNHRDTCIRFKVKRVTQKLEVYLANEESSLAVCSADLGHIIGGDVQIDLGKLLRGKSLYETVLAHATVRVHWVMFYSDIVEYNIVGDTKSSLLRCFNFLSKLNSVHLKTTGQCMNYQTFSNF